MITAGTALGLSSRLMAGLALGVFRAVESLVAILPRIVPRGGMRSTAECHAKITGSFFQVDKIKLHGDFGLWGWALLFYGTLQNTICFAAPTQDSEVGHINLSPSIVIYRPNFADVFRS